MPRSVWSVVASIPALGAEPGDLLVRRRRGPHLWILVRPIVDGVTSDALHAAARSLIAVSVSPGDVSPAPDAEPGARPPRSRRRRAALRLV